MRTIVILFTLLLVGHVHAVTKIIGVDETVTISCVSPTTWDNSEPLDPADLIEVQVTIRKGAEVHLVTMPGGCVTTQFDLTKLTQKGTYNLTAKAFATYRGVPEISKASNVDTITMISPPKPTQPMLEAPQ